MKEQLWEARGDRARVYSNMEGGGHGNKVLAHDDHNIHTEQKELMMLAVMESSQSPSVLLAHVSF